MVTVTVCLSGTGTGIGIGTGIATGIGTGTGTGPCFSSCSGFTPGTDTGTGRSRRALATIDPAHPEARQARQIPDQGITHRTACLEQRRFVRAPRRAAQATAAEILENPNALVVHRVLVIPVIDLCQGTVVHAVRGERANYRPVESALAQSAEPLAVARALCEHCATETLYLADLDALQGGALQLAAIASLLAAHPARQLWLDAGFSGLAALRALRSALGDAAARVRPVLGSETWASLDELPGADRAQPRPLLSLDRRGTTLLDKAGVWRAPQHWPPEVIVMCLDRVGSGGGPDLATLGEVRAAARGAGQALQLIGAGGVRHVGDLHAAAAAGASAWLVASALHDGRLTAGEVRGLA